MHYRRMICIGWDVSYKFGKCLYIFIAMLIYCDIMWILKSVQIVNVVLGSKSGIQLKQKRQGIWVPCFGMNQ